MTADRSSATVRRLWRETPRLWGVVLEVEPDVAARYTAPGQVVALHPEGAGPVYLALASAPGEARAFELLVNEGAKDTMGLAEGGTVQLEGPIGAGFALERAKGKDVLLFAVGSALAPIRTLVEALRRDRAAYGRVVLYVGAHTPEDFPYAAQFDGWGADGIEIVRAVSRPWVQALFEADPPPVQGAVAFVCGMSEMMNDVTEALVRAGMAEDDVGRNW